MNLLDLLFPIKCLGCGIEKTYICLKCLKKEYKPYFKNKNLSIFKYAGLFQKVLKKAKYNHSLLSCEHLASMCSILLESKKDYFLGSILVPIPMYWRKENERGYNQTIVICRIISEKLGVNMIPDLLIKTKDTLAQVLVNNKQRRINLLGTFKVNEKYLENKRLLNSKIILFDDVYTTGSTIQEATEVLEKSGFKNISSFTLSV